MQLGIAAFRTESPVDTKETIKHKLIKGFRYFEITELFCNAHLFKEVFDEHNLKRADIYIALKVWPKDKNPDALFHSCKKLIELTRLEVNF